MNAAQSGALLNALRAAAPKAVGGVEGVVKPEESDAEALRREVSQKGCFSMVSFGIFDLPLGWLAGTRDLTPSSSRRTPRPSIPSAKGG